MVRTEFEYAIPDYDAEEIMRTMCGGEVLDKVRHFVPHAGMTWYVDAYEGILSGIVLTEIELTQPDQEFSLPNWIGEEVTGDSTYRKVNMRAHHIAKLMSDFGVTSLDELRIHDRSSLCARG